LFQYGDLHLGQITISEIDFLGDQLYPHLLQFAFFDINIVYRIKPIYKTSGFKKIKKEKLGCKHPLLVLNHNIKNKLLSLFEDIY